MIPFAVGIPAVVILCLLLQGCDGGEDDKCPPWHFTPANATTPCSGCSFPETDDFYCNDTGLIIDTYFIVTATNGSYPLVIGKGVFGRYKPEHLLCNSVMFTKLPSNTSELENFFCSAFKRQGFLCGQCKPGCGIAIYTYYGLVCECPCYSYGIPLYILLEIGFSTLFFAVLAVCSFSVNSSKWITVILYYQVIANAVNSDSTTYTVLAKSVDWVPIVLQSLYSIWNMDFLRLVIPRFCVSQGVSILGAISAGYISAFWPLVLVVLTSLAMHLHKRNYKLVVYAWNIINWMSHDFIQQQLAGINLIHTFATFFVLSYLKVVFISISLLKPYHTAELIWKGQQLKHMHLLSSDPSVVFLSHGHLLYAVPASIVLVLIGILLPLVLILYPTRCGTWLGGRLQSGRLRNAVRTFVEAMNGSYKDGSAGTKDYRSLPGLMLLLRGVTTAVITFRGNGIVTHKYSYLCISLLVLALAALFGLCKPYKTKFHNLFDVSIFCLLAVLCICFLMMLSCSSEFAHSMLVVLMFLPFFVVVVGLLKQLIMNLVSRIKSFI